MDMDVKPQGGFTCSTDAEDASTTHQRRVVLMSLSLLHLTLAMMFIAVWILIAQIVVGDRSPASLPPAES